MLKKKNAKAAKAAKPAKAKKRSKKAQTQSRFGQGGIKALFSQHVEKLALGFIGLATLLIVFFAYRREGLDASQSPAQLATAANRARNHIEASTWTEVASSLLPEKDNYQSQASADMVALNVTDYVAPQDWEPLKFAMRTKRLDPELEPVVDLEVSSGVGPLAVVTKKRTSLIAPSSGYGTGYDSQIGLDPNIRELPPDLAARVRGSFQAPQEAEIRPESFVCINGLIPFRKQYAAYKAALQEAGEMIIDRDMPKYLSYEVERTEVGADGKPGEWKLVWGEWKKDRWTAEEKAARDLVGKWAGVPEELAKLEAYDPATAFYLPPLFNRDLTQFASHSKIGLEPAFENAYASEGGYGGEYGQQNPLGALSEGGPPIPGAGSDPYGGGYANPYGRSPYPSAHSSEGRSGNPYGSSSRPPSGYGSGSSRPPSGYGSGANPYGRRPGGAVGYGSEGGYGAGGITVDEFGMPLEEHVPEYKLFRFFDFTVEPGKAYRYRVRLWLEDPNNPYDTGLRVLLQDMDKTVVNRLKALPTGENRVFWRMADWSEESETIRVARDEYVLAGTVTAPPPKTLKINDQPVTYENPTREPEANLMVVEFSAAQAGDIPGELTKVRRGAVANFTKKDAEVIDPLKMQLKKIKDHNFQSDILVLDMMGGQRLPGGRDSKDRLDAPGEILVMTPAGQLVVRRELEDAVDYRANTLPPEDEMDAGGYPYGGASSSGYDAYSEQGGGGRRNRARGGRNDNGYGPGSEGPARPQRRRSRSGNGY